MNTSETPMQPSYEAPRIINKGQLKQFAGSPLKAPGSDALDVLGLP